MLENPVATAQGHRSFPPNDLDLMSQKVTVLLKYKAWVSRADIEGTGGMLKVRRVGLSVVI